MTVFKKPAFLISRANANGTKRHYWSPSATRKAQGWRMVELRNSDSRWMSDGAAVDCAAAINAVLAAYDRECRGQTNALAEVRAAHQSYDLWIDRALPSGMPMACTTRSGTVQDLIDWFLASDDVTEKAKDTQRFYRDNLRALAKDLGKISISHLSRPVAAGYYKIWAGHEGRKVTVPLPDKDGRLHDCKITARGKAVKAGAIVRAARACWSAGYRSGRAGLPTVHDSAQAIGQNPWSNLKVKSALRTGRIWTADLVSAMADAIDAAGYPSMATAFLLNLWVGQRPADILALRWRALKGDKLLVKQNKTGKSGTLTLSAAVMQRLEEEAARTKSTGRLPVGAQPIFINERTGRPWTPNRFSHEFAFIRDAVAREQNLDALIYPTERPDFPAHLPKSEWPVQPMLFRFCRHTAVVALARAWAKDHHDMHSLALGIAAVTMHQPQSVLQILKHYHVQDDHLADAAMRARMAAEAAAQKKC